MSLELFRVLVVYRPHNGSDDYRISQPIAHQVIVCSSLGAIPCLGEVGTHPKELAATDF